MKKIRINKWFSYLILFIPLIYFFFLNYRENDNWFLFSYGRYLLKNGFPHTEFLTMHKGLHFVMPQWFSALTFYSIYKTLGFLGLYLFIFLILILFIYLLYKLCIIISNNKILVSCIVTMFITILYENLYITPRPHIFTYLILLGVLIILELYIKNKKDYLLLLPLLSIIQINFHASMWPVFFIFIMPFTAELLIDLIISKKKNKKIYKLLLIILICILVGFINPYGIENMTYSLNSYGNELINKSVVEMLSFKMLFTTNKKLKVIILFMLFFIINLLLIIKDNKKREMHEILLIYGTFFTALVNYRNFGLFYIGALPFIAKYFNIKESKSRYFPIIPYILIITVLIFALVNSIKEKKYIINNPNKEIVKYLNKNTNKKIKIYTFYDDGAYLEYYGYKPYMDPRAEVFTKKLNKKEDIYTEYYNYKYKDYYTYKEFNKKYNFDYYIVKFNDYTLINLLEKDNYKIVYETDERYLYKKIKGDENE